MSAISIRLPNDPKEKAMRLARKHNRLASGPASDVDRLVDVRPEHSAFLPGGLVADWKTYWGDMSILLNQQVYTGISATRSCMKRCLCARR